MTTDTTNVQETKNKPKTWWKRKEILGALGLLVLNTAANPLFATVNPWIPVVANTLLSGLTIFGVVQGVSAKNMKPTKENYKIGSTEK